jgi:hypothetical protein
MKVVKIGALITFILVLSILVEFFPVTRSGAVDNAVVFVSSPPGAYYGDTFVVKVCVSAVNKMQAYQIQLNYNGNVIQVDDIEGGSDGVTEGVIDNSTIGVDVWSYFPSGTEGNTIRIGGRVNNNSTVSGSGYLAEIHFRVMGLVGQSSQLTPIESKRFKNRLFDDKGNQISTINPWSGTSVYILTPVPLQIGTMELPKGVVGRAYSAGLTAIGGYHPYTWNANGLPSGLAISESGVLTGKINTPGDYTINISVSDSQDPPNTISRAFLFRNCLAGDANEDGLVNRADVYKIIKISLGVEPITPAADANGDGKVNMADVVKTQKIYQSP